MKITIEPSDHKSNASAVTIDLRTDDEVTTEAVDAALNALIVYGHDAGNVADAAEAYAVIQHRIQATRASNDTNTASAV